MDARRVVLATGPAQSAYEAFGKRYAEALARFNPKVNVQSVVETATATGKPYSLIRLSHSDFDQIRDRLAIPGIVATDQAELLAEGFRLRHRVGLKGDHALCS